MNYVILLLAGRGKRLGSTKNKVFLHIGHKMVCEYAIETFVMHDDIHHMILVHHSEDSAYIRQIMESYGSLKPMSAVLGGEQRQDSVRQGLIKIGELSEHAHQDNVLIHNGCNPFIHHDEITQLLLAIKNRNNAAALALPVKDTLRTVFNNQAVVTIPRDIIWSMQTPQAIPLDMAFKAYAEAEKKPFHATDEMEFVMRLGYEVTIIPYSEKNFKITTQEDLYIARAIALQTITLIGIGEDSHRYHHDKNGLWLGGLFIKEAPATIAHSDGDVILHALYNAISSAIGEGSIGESFPETEEFKDKSSVVFIEHLKLTLLTLALTVKQISISITAKQPLIAPLAHPIKQSLSQLFSLEERQVGITATSGENMSHEGQGRGIRAMVIVSLGPLVK